ncbi:hypothetical protein QA640_24380 [Bradyrhizobium sp. CB82]|uniref:hypothetical protein n=1 Tax=Bradyrhizobium sp. CB82 TaxID=3039159 RepID=UPI0024B24F6D|nr:hypothetical protein [Bradyrhizobium sp. CB82]WFU37608.1 hypothetical protein QA640_24380 [Bradyrhizobium sp. CB82]
MRIAYGLCLVTAGKQVPSRPDWIHDGEAVILGVDGVPVFNALHGRKHDQEVQFCAFDILAMGWRRSARPAAAGAMRYR